MREGGIGSFSFLDEVVVCLAKIQVYDEKQYHISHQLSGNCTKLFFNDY